MLTFANTMHPESCQSSNRDRDPPMASDPYNRKSAIRELANAHVPRTCTHPSSQSTTMTNGPRGKLVNLQSIVSCIFWCKCVVELFIKLLMNVIVMHMYVTTAFPGLRQAEQPCREPCILQ